MNKSQNVPINSLLVNYFLSLNHDLKSQFVESYCHSDGFYKTSTAGGEIVDTTKDKDGNEIKEDHPLFGLTKIINEFKAGTDFNPSSLTNSELKQFLESGGEHFCAGYLWRQGPIPSEFNINHTQFINSRYRVAWRVYQNTKTKKPEKIIDGHICREL